jgi:hypothetical protein
MNDLGHNLPPGMADTATDVAATIREWMTEHPVVDSEEAAREAKLQLDRAKLCAADMEAERKAKVTPLNNQVKEINDSYKPAQTILGAIINEINRRITAFLAKEEAKRIKAAEEARRAAEAAERAAREAEEREKQAVQDSDDGVVVDVAGAAAEADEKFEEYQKAARQAGLAERDSKVRIGGGFTRSLTLRNKETLIVTDAVTAINAIGMTLDLEAAILKGARAYRTIHGELPDGIESKTERSV